MKNAIYEARKTAQLTQAEAAKYLGVSKRTIEEWEAENRNPKGGADAIAKKIRILGSLTEEGREAIAVGEYTWEEAAREERITQAKRLSKWGRYGGTFNACLTQIPECVAEKLDGEELAALIDSIKEVYDAGCAHGAE